MTKQSKQINQKEPHPIDFDAIGREDQLILCCARSVVDEKAANRIAALLSEGIDWRRFLDRTFHHRVTPLVHRTLCGIEKGAVPPEVLTAFGQRCHAIAQRNLYLSAALIRIGARIDDQGTPFIPYKGPALAAMVYGNVAMREFGDLDVLVHADHYRPITEFFLRDGYRMANNWGWECTLTDDARSVSVDVHNNLAPPQFPVALDFGRLYADRAALPVLGRSVRTLCLEDMLLVLCIQLMKDCWGVSSLRLSKLCDVAEILRAEQPIDWTRVKERAAQAGVGRIVGAAILASQEFLGAPHRSGAPCLESRVLARAVMSRVTARLFHESNGPTGERQPSASFHFRLRERWRDKLYPFYLDLLGQLKPNELDHELVKLPQSLQFLYYAVKPIRVFATRAVAGLGGIKKRLQRRDR